MEQVHVRGGVGAGDVIHHLNVAHSWSKCYECAVHLLVHWEESEEFWYVKGDPESAQQRYHHVHERMKESDRVTVEHVYRSDLFAMSEELRNDSELRRKVDPPRVITDSREFRDTQHYNIYGSPAWEWKDEPTEEKVVVCWHQYKNREDIRDYKSIPFDGDQWRIVLVHELTNMFPEHQFKMFNYRSDFRDVYEWVRKADFCVGYDGMWHGVARNFSKVFVTATGDLSLVHSITNPNTPAFVYAHQFWAYLNQLRDSSFLKSEQEYMKRVNEARMKLLENPS